MASNKLPLDGIRYSQFDPQFDADATPLDEWRSILARGRWQTQFDGMLKLL